MIKSFRRQTVLAQTIVKEHLYPGDSAIDGTIGTGSDTMMLARCVGPTGKVYGFDIQAEAINQTSQNLADEGLQDIAQLYNLGHETIDSQVDIQNDSHIRAAMFNLGYLPGGDKTIVTHTDTTIQALNGALEAMTSDSIMTICAYGHAEGKTEMQAVEEWCQKLRHGIDVYRMDTINHKNSPILYIVHKVRDQQ